MDTFKSLVNDLEQANVDMEDDHLGNVTRMEDIYLDEWRDLVQKRLIVLTILRKLYLHVED